MVFYMWIYFSPKARRNRREEVETKADKKSTRGRERGMIKPKKKGKKNRCFMLTPSWQCGEESKRQERRSRRETEVREMWSRQGLSWRHYSWLMEWELAWQSKAGCLVTEGEQETGERGHRGLYKVELCAFVCLSVCLPILFFARRAVNTRASVQWMSVSLSFWLFAGRSWDGWSWLESVVLRYTQVYTTGSQSFDDWVSI